MIPLFDTWSNFLTAHGVTEAPHLSFTELMNRHGVPKRFYHTFTGHIEMVMNEFEPARALCPNPLVVEGALWTHDVVYDSEASDNEAKSALWMNMFYGRRRISKEYRDRVAPLIAEASKRHIGIPGNLDWNAFISCDLAILGRPWPEYVKYVGDVDLEYEWVVRKYGAEVRSNARIEKFLDPFLKRDPLFPHEYFYEKYEKRAKENIRREIELRKAGKPIL